MISIPILVALLLAAAGVVLSASALVRSRRKPAPLPPPPVPLSTIEATAQQAEAARVVRPQLKVVASEPVEAVGVPPEIVAEAIAAQRKYEEEHVERQRQRVSTGADAHAHVQHGAYTPDQRLTAVSQRVQRACPAGVSPASIRTACATSLAEVADA